MGTMNKNTTNKNTILKTHEDGTAAKINFYLTLKRSVLANLLWENTFYENGESVVERIKSLVKKVDNKKIMNLAIEARNKFNLRHVPLLLARELARKKYKVSNLLYEIIQRPDELSEFLAIYWKDGKIPIAKQIKKGLAKAFTKFDEYQLAKWNRKKDIMLRDVLFLTHAKPLDKKQENLWKRLIDDKLETPDTWETNLSAGKNKKEAWERLLEENKLGAMALIMNLRNIIKANVNNELVKNALINMKTEKVFPYRFYMAEKFAPGYSKELEQAMFKSSKEFEKLSGKTILLLDISGSMANSMSMKSETTRASASAGLAMLIKEICEDSEVFVFNTEISRIPERRGFALADKITSSVRGGTYLGKAIEYINNFNYDRLIVFTDEQSADDVPSPSGKGYIINVASYENGIGYGKWTHIDGFSSSIIKYITEFEKELN